MFDRMNGIGAHEVIIETPDHTASLATLPPKRIEDVLWTFRDRILDLKKDRRFKYILLFKNHGEAAGASLEHAHSQLIALPILPINVTQELEGRSSTSYTRSVAYSATSSGRKQKTEAAWWLRTKIS